MNKLYESNDLKWLANMFPFIKEPKDESDRISNAIHIYSENGARKIDELQAELDKYKNVYMVSKISFDSMENNIHSAICEEYEGVIIGTDQDVQLWLENNKPIKSYKGWDGKEYPYYKVTPLNIIQ